MRRQLVVALLLALCTAQACRHEEKTDVATKANPAAPSDNTLPPFTFGEATPNLLITWIDDKGDFHVVQKPSAVPQDARKTVRVVQVERDEGTGKLVYVSNLTETTPDGNFRTTTMARTTWDEMGASKRKARLEALAPSSLPVPSGSTSAAPSPKAAAPLGKVTVILYGASWCKPCHDAEAYLKARGANVIHKDIDESDAARSEMQRKLERAGMGGASIPVIDVMGQILIGYSPRALDRALEAARASKPL
ncbi:MAG TPA: glutaredoxin domain-containing protein [Polyangiaceae bacterium]|nr:glutaredoxin domain-containing protein [Polyangiaceae bacterium]